MGSTEGLGVSGACGGRVSVCWGASLRRCRRLEAEGRQGGEGRGLGRIPASLGSKGRGYPGQRVLIELGRRSPFVSPHNPERNSLQGKGERKKKVGYQIGSGVLGSRHHSRPRKAAVSTQGAAGFCFSNAVRAALMVSKAAAWESRLWRNLRPNGAGPGVRLEGQAGAPPSTHWPRERDTPS